MSKFAVLFGRSDRPATSLDILSGAAENQTLRRTFADLGTQIGSDHEALRDLLVNVERKVLELDDLKQAFEEIVAPVSATILALETEKSLAFSLNESLTVTREALDGSKHEAHQLRQSLAELEFDRDQLRHALERSQAVAAELDRERQDLTAQLAAEVAHSKDVEQQYAHAVENAATLQDKNHVLRGHMQLMRERIGTLEGNLAAATEELALLNDEKRSLQASIERHVAEGSRLSRIVSESKTAFQSARERVAEAESRLATALQEKDELRLGLDETQERSRSEMNLLTTRLEAVQARADIAERLLAEARENIVSLSENVRVSDQNAEQAIAACQAAERSQSQIRATQESYERQIKDLEAAQTSLTERLDTAMRKLAAREHSLAQALGRVASMSDRTAGLEAEMQSSRSTYEQRIDELSAELHRERMDKAVLQGALDSARKKRMPKRRNDGGTPAVDVPKFLQQDGQADGDGLVAAAHHRSAKSSAA